VQSNEVKVIPEKAVIEAIGSDTDSETCCDAAGKFSLNFASADFNPLSP
jgi:hypothetical protein